MESANFGDGVVSLAWSGVSGEPGLQPRLALIGKLTARDFGLGAVAQVSAEVTAWDIDGTYAYLGATTPQSFPLMWARMEMGQANPRPQNERSFDVRLMLPLMPTAIEQLEQRRGGKNFALLVDVTVLLVDRGERDDLREYAFHETYPLLTSQDRIAVEQSDWAKVLERWERGTGISIVLPLAEIDPHATRADIVRHIRDARQKIDGADYAGSVASARKALELLRELSPVAIPIPGVPKDRDVSQRVHAVIDALFSLASASAHEDGPVKNYEPTRSDAVTLAGATASVAQNVFSRLRGE